ncbi:MAG: hypothetical protein LBC87_01395 [Fibromonadaceae bacterium]|jgi:opacity protein-like surface antigen|nr:hypothetical protein [Fibromonadaceae bacterium]
MKKALKSLVAIAILATATFAANVENPLYAPAQFGFYSKTGFSFMYKQSDANLAMKAKDWEYQNEYILRGYEDFGFGLTDRFSLRGAFGYTHDFSIERSGPHNARLGIGYRAINQPVETVVWDLYMDAWLGGISKMKANLIASTSPLKDIRDSMPLSFKYDNYANGRWGVWLGTVVGKTFDRVTVAAFGEVQKTFGNNNNQIKIDKSADTVIQDIVKGSVLETVRKSVYNVVLGQYIERVCQAYQINPAYCSSAENYKEIQNAAKTALDGDAEILVQIEQNAQATSGEIAKDYVKGLPNDFNVDTKGIWDYVAGLKTLYEINNNWSMGGGFTWRHRGTNSVEKMNISSTSKNLDPVTVAAITKGIGDSFKGSMEDGVEEFTLSLQGSRQFTKDLQLTLFGEFTFDTAEDKAQLGSDIRAEVGLRLNWQF